MGVKEISDNRDKLREAMDAAARRAGRKPEEIRLMAVSKTRSREEILEAYEAGLRIFGENRVQEAQAKFTGIPRDLELHLIGHLQRNKARQVPGLFRSVHSLDKEETARELDKRCGNAGEVLPVLLEVNTSGEDTKNGFAGEKPFFEGLEAILAMDNLRIKGLMTMAPFTREEQPVRRAFRELKALYDKTASRYPELEMEILSMGMSSDFTIAIEEGSTLVRIGTALFGARG